MTVIFKCNRIKEGGSMQLLAAKDPLRIKGFPGLSDEVIYNDFRAGERGRGYTS
jgi:hypothetical protein